MLDTDTKRCIDTAREIPAGNVTLIDFKTGHVGRLAEKYHHPDEPLPDHPPGAIPGTTHPRAFDVCGRTARYCDALTGFEIAVKENYLTISLSKIICYQEGPQKKPPTRDRTDHLTVPVGLTVR